MLLLMAHMKIGILSDTHDNIADTHRAITMLEEVGCMTIFHCGDLCAPFMLAELEKHKIPIHLVFGNVDDRYLTTKLSESCKYVKLHGDVATLKLGGKRICITHFPQIADAFAKSQDFDIVCYGHTHIAKTQTVQKTLLINPGEILGRFGKKTCVVFDTRKDKITLLQVE
jgi:putative phosphoesterase